MVRRGGADSLLVGGAGCGTHKHTLPHPGRDLPGVSRDLEQVGPAPGEEPPGDHGLLRYWGGGGSWGVGWGARVCGQLRGVLVPVLGAGVLREPGPAPHHLPRGAQVHRGEHRGECRQQPPAGGRGKGGSGVRGRRSGPGRVPAAG
uniref:Uncharacterized protein n=1 Tax=Accipiter nisus TaxID=211598 RepID=A0A8B9RV15_9AVES